MHNLKRRLSTSKKQVKDLKDDNKKCKTRIDLLTKKINQMNNELRKEKKAAKLSNLSERSSFSGRPSWGGKAAKLGGD